MKTEVNNLMFKHIHTNKMGLCNSRKHMPLSRKGFFFRWFEVKRWYTHIYRERGEVY